MAKFKIIMQRKLYRLKAGNVNRLKVSEELLPPCASDEVMIEVKSIGLNFADIFAIWGLYSATPKEAFIPGLEYAGIVKAQGDEVEGNLIGQKVMGVIRFGAYTTHLNIDYRYIIKLPDDWSFEEGAAYPVQVLTAYYALTKLGDLQDNQTVLIHSGAGGVGLLANKIAKTKNAFTIGTVGRPEKVNFLKQEGYDEVIVRGSSFKSDLKNALGKRELNVVMECIGGKVLSDAYELMAPQGRMVVYGAARYASPGSRPNYLKLLYQHLTRPKIDPQGMTDTNKGLLGFNLIWLYERVQLMHDLMTEIEQLNIGKPHVGHRFSFEELPDAIRLFQSGKTIGKVVINT